ncbi:trehalose 6-phosphate phosphatase [Mycolicibacterium insubricum]|mgnify:CR=1 FL=1|uniref:trehalose-phosphatase n=1 Tax=Mycolicibacterium insubricum TaxID=444597 RepID=UPI00138BC1C8|nr:trehalose-phosphatase [Mycolicibacterium insubricum]BBZ64647.1 trehalose 6-phosphate phosphatase [Mycolicibacterium insubricum]
MSRIPSALTAALRGAAVAPRILVASDFDGTLSHLVDHPPDARPVDGAVTALGALADVPGVTVALISGRALESLRAVAGVGPPVRLIGSHGAEDEDGFGSAVDTALRDRIIAALNEIATGQSGVTVEPKPAGAALHVRNAAPEVGAAALERARTAGDGWNARVTEGKAVLEFSVVHTDKGSAIDKLRSSTGADAVVFLGDDVTDETVFAVLGPADIGVKIGDGPSRAEFRIESPEDAVVMLEFLRAARVDQLL